MWENAVTRPMTPLPPQEMMEIYKNIPAAVLDEIPLVAKLRGPASARPSVDAEGGQFFRQFVIYFEDEDYEARL